MRVTEILTEESDPRIVAMQRSMRKAGATNPDGTPLTIDGALGPNTRAVMSNPQFAKYVPRDVSLGTNSGPHRIAKQPAAAPAPAQPEAVPVQPEAVPVQPAAAPVAAAPAEPATAPPDSNVGATSTLASPLPSLAAAPAEPAPAVARPAMPHTATPADAYAPEVPTSIDPIVRKRQGLPPATTAEIDAYEKANPPVVSGAVDRNGQPIISGGQKKVIDAAREAAPKELDGHQQAQNMLQPGYNTTTGQNKNISKDTRDNAAMAGNETGGRFDISYGDTLDPKTNTVINKTGYESPGQWAKRTLGTSMPLTQFTLQQVRDFQKYKDSVQSGSGAVGAFQFMPNTLFGRVVNGKTVPGLVQQLNLPMDTKFNQQTQQLLQDKLLAANDSVLKKGGVEVSSGNRYMAQYIGGGGAVGVHQDLKTNPNITVAQSMVKRGFADPTKKNPELAIITVGQFPEVMAQRMAGNHGWGKPTKQQFAQLAASRGTAVAESKQAVSDSWAIRMAENVLNRI